MKGNKIINVYTPESIANCPYCNKTVFDNNLFVEIDSSIYHFSCHNRKVQEENESR